VQRGALKGAMPADRRRAYKSARTACLSSAVPDEVILFTLGKGDPERARAQVPDAHERRRQFEDVLMDKGGKRGEGLDSIWRAVELMRAEEAHQASPAPLCLPMSAALANKLIKREAERTPEAGKRLHDDFLWMVKHLRWPIDVAKEVTGALASSLASGTGQSKKRKHRAGTHPLAFKMQLEYLASKGPTRYVRHYARSRLILGVDTSIRTEDAEAGEVRRLSDPGEVGAFAPLTKDGEPIELFTVARGFLGEYDWVEEWMTEVEALQGRPFPHFRALRGTKGSIRGAIAWTEGAATKEEIRARTIELAAMPPLELPAEVWGKKGSLGLTGHSDHGSEPDWAKTIGPLPPTLPYAAALTERPPRGFLREERRALGHWLRDAEEDAEEAAAHPKRWKTTDAGVRPAVTAGAPQNAEMVSLYTMGETRSGEHDEQIRLRGRLADYGRAAIDAWTGHWQLPWWRLPTGRDDRYILTRPPDTLAPRPEIAPAHVRVRWSGT
jgi:hypothetical protein